MPESQRNSQKSIDLSLIQGAEVDQEPKTLTGSPANWYERAEELTIGQEQQKISIGDWVIRPHQTNFMLMQVTKQTLARLAKERSKAISEYKDLLRTRESVRLRAQQYEDVNNVFATELSPHPDIDKLIEQHPAMNSQQQERLAVEHVDTQPSALRVLLRMKVVPPAWTEEDMLLADRGPLAASYCPDGEERVLWIRRGDARWRPVIVGNPGNISVDDIQMSTLNPKPVVISEVDD